MIAERKVVEMESKDTETRLKSASFSGFALGSATPMDAEPDPYENPYESPYRINTKEK